jgi:uncharacterized phage protein gp47/JayE
MPRSPRKSSAAIVQAGLRIREGLRFRLQQEAKRRAVSLNAEMARRLENSFDQDARRSLDTIAADLQKVCDRLTS